MPVSKRKNTRERNPINPTSSDDEFILSYKSDWENGGFESCGSDELPLLSKFKTHSFRKNSSNVFDSDSKSFHLQMFKIFLNQF